MSWRIWTPSHIRGLKPLSPFRLSLGLAVGNGVGNVRAFGALETRGWSCAASGALIVSGVEPSGGALSGGVLVKLFEEEIYLLILVGG